MSYSDVVSSLIKKGIISVVPNHPMTATISGGVFWYTHNWAMTYLPGYLAWQTQSTVAKTLGFLCGAESNGSILGYLAAPIFVPETTSYMATRLSIIAAVGTSLTLNLIAASVFNLKARRNAEQAMRQAKQFSKHAVIAPVPNIIPDTCGSPFPPRSFSDTSKIEEDELMTTTKPVPPPPPPAPPINTNPPTKSIIRSMMWQPPKPTPVSSPIISFSETNVKRPISSYSQTIDALGSKAIGNQTSAPTDPAAQTDLPQKSFDPNLFADQKAAANPRSKIKKILHTLLPCC